jgi:mono/diheme cytochrome c family protein/plastocyanin
MTAPRERLALLVVVLIVAGIPLAALGYQYGLRPGLAAARVVDIRAVVPDSGGFLPGAVQANVGEPITLRFSAEDVAHGVAIGPGLDVDLGQIDPGQVREITLTFDRPGTYTYYCTTWCSPDHWRMRGVIEVRDPAAPEGLPTAQRDPVIETLVAEGVNVDATPTPDPQAVTFFDPEHPLSVQQGADFMTGLTIPGMLESPAWQRSHTPLEALSLLATANPYADPSRLADVIAYLWLRDNSAETLETGRNLYNPNCAACHGETGQGNGPAASGLATTPPVFADPAYMFTRRDDVLYAKIRRGGMGTDMPNFGTVFTPEETWALVAYLRSLSSGPVN